MAIRGTILEDGFDAQKQVTVVVVYEGGADVTTTDGNRTHVVGLEPGGKITVDMPEGVPGSTPAEFMQKTKESEPTRITIDEADQMPYTKVEKATTEDIERVVEVVNGFERAKEDEKIIEYTVNGEVEYGVDPSSVITIADEFKDLKGLKYTYSSGGTAGFKEFDVNNPLDSGKYFVRIENNDGYDSMIKPITISKIEIKINAMSAEIPYGSDPKESITFKNAPANAVIKYSTSADGEFKEYDSENPLALGKWYFTVDAGSNYTFTVNYFTVTKASLSAPVNLTPVYRNGVAFLNASANELEDFFKSEVGATPNDPNHPDYDSSNHSEYLYYVVVEYAAPGNEVMYDILINHDNLSALGRAGETYTDVFNIRITYNLPAEYEIPVTSYTCNLENYLDVEFVYVTKEETGCKINAIINHYDVNSGTSDTPVWLYYNMGDLMTEPIPLVIEGGKCSAEVNGSEFSFYFGIGETELKSETYNFNINNFVSDEYVATNVALSADDPSTAVVTYNLDNTVNMYYNIGFENVGEEDLKNLVIYTYSADVIEETMYIVNIGTKEYSILEDMKNRNEYRVEYVAAFKEVNGLNYVCIQDNSLPDIAVIPIEIPVLGYINAADDAYYAESYPFFIKGTNIDLYDMDGNLITSVVDFDFQGDNNTSSFTTSLLDFEYTDNEVHVSGTIYGWISPSAAGTYDVVIDEDYGVFTDEVFAAVTSKLAESGITIKGSNKHYVDKVKFSED